jgi:dTDP-4-amino-4,6-dideoxygalactose transaminase
MPDNARPSASAHPDQALLARWRIVLDAWEASVAAEWPTSQVLGGGAIATVEDLVSQAHDGRPCLLLPSATYALRLALATAGVGTADAVTLVEDGWPAGIQAARSLGAEVHLVRPPVGTEPWTPDTGRGPIVVTDSPDDVDLLPAVRAGAPGALVIEDASRLHPTDPDSPVRRRSGDYVVYSLGPAKPVDAGEGGLLICPDGAAYARALALSAHPTRLAYRHLEEDPAALPMRVHPITAIVAWWALST